jgi:hypothetical protein
MAETGQQDFYAINTNTLEAGIQLYVQPVIDEMTAVNGSYTGAHTDVAAAHANQTPGWFAGAADGDVHAASSSFLNEAEWQLQRLASEQTQLLGSLQEYVAFLRAHMQWATDTDQKFASNFQSIHSELDDGRGK